MKANLLFKPFPKNEISFYLNVNPFYELQLKQNSYKPFQDL